MQDPIADLLTQIRNGQSARKTKINLPASKMKASILRVLETQGYIEGFSVLDGDVGKKRVEVKLKYHGPDAAPVINKITRVSKPGLRVYKTAEELPKVLGGFGIAVISTSSGIMCDRKAREKNVGGEVLCVVE
jgi:small subunit ribosomal protein S8